MNYYNELDPYCAQWLRNLIAAGHLPEGEVDERDIRRVSPSDLRGFTQCHFFAGIGGWPLALRLAGWPTDRAVWTGSCPCQPFSVAGSRKGTADYERHLWPEFHRLIYARKPAIVFGEQVASNDGREWLTGVRTDLEALGYAVGAADLCAASSGAPHIRQRLWWVADTAPEGRIEERQIGRGITSRDSAEGWPAGPGLRGASGLGGLAITHGWLSGDRDLQRSGEHGLEQEDGGVMRLVYTAEQQEGIPRCSREPRGTNSGMGNAAIQRLSERTGGEVHGGESRREPQRPSDSGFWGAYDTIYCLDQKSRRIEPGTFPLAHGVPARVGKLRAYGNAIVPQVAAAFIGAFMEVAA